VKKRDGKVIEQQPCGDDVADKTIEPEYTTGHSLEENEHGTVRKNDTALVEEQQLNVNNESTNPDSIVDSLPDDCDDTNPADASVGSFHNMDERARVKEIGQMTLPIELDKEDPSVIPNIYSFNETDHKEVKKRDGKVIEQQPCGDDVADKTIEPEYTTGHSLEENEHGTVRKNDTALVEEQQLNVNNESTNPDSIVDSLPDDCDDTNPADASVGSFHNMDERARVKEIGQMTLPIELDKEDPSVSLTSISEIEPRESISSKEIDNDDMTDTVYEMKGPVGPHIFDSKGCNGNDNINITFELHQVAPTLPKEEEGLEAIRQAPQENGQEEEIKQLHADGPLQDITISPCSVEVVPTLSKQEEILEEIHQASQEYRQQEEIEQLQADDPLQDSTILPCSVESEHSSHDGKTVTSFQHVQLGFMFRVSSEMI